MLVGIGAGRAQLRPTSTPLAAGAPPTRTRRAIRCTVFVMTLGPGDHPFLRFGHDAIWIRDRAAGTDRVYNFGTFRFDSPRLILDFLGGRLNYWLSVSSLPRVIAEYTRENREHRRPGAGADRRREERRCGRRWRSTPAPRTARYKYDYFLDNCSTRVRDAVDRVAGGGCLRATGRRRDG